MQTNYGKLVFGYHLRRGIKTSNSQSRLLESIAQVGANLNNIQLRYSIGKVHNNRLGLWKHEFGISFSPLIYRRIKYHSIGNPEF